MKTFENFIPEDILSNIKRLINTSGWNYGWRSNKSIGYGHWNIDFSNAISENGIDIADDIPEELQMAWKYIKSTYFPEMDLIRCYTNSHTYGIEGYPHTDSKNTNDVTVVVYLNEHWKREWGGETMIYDNSDIIHASLPKYNKAISFSGTQFHTARGVTRICPELRKTLMFKMTTAKCNTDRNRLQRFLESVGASEKQHTGRTLTGHLLSVYDLLKNTNQDLDTCLAGGLHSTFGTNVYTTKTLTLNDISKFEQEFGSNVLGLVTLFSQINRPSTLEIALSTNETSLICTNGEQTDVTEKQLKSLCAIECANLIDQNSLKTLPNLEKYWNLISN